MCKQDSMDNNIYVGAAVVVIIALAVIFLLPSTQPAQNSNYTNSSSITNSSQANILNASHNTSSITNISTNNTSNTSNAMLNTTVMQPYVFNVTLNEYSITPSTITVPSGAEVRIVAENKGVTSHTFTISNFTGGQGYFVDTGFINSGLSKEVNFTAPAPGNYTYFCRVPGHEGLGMQGALIVK